MPLKDSLYLRVRTEKRKQRVSGRKSHTKPKFLTGKIVGRQWIRGIAQKIQKKRKKLVADFGFSCSYK